MENENTPRALSVEEGVLALRQSREEAAKAPEAEAVENEDQAEEVAPEETEAETEEVQEDHTEEEAEADAEPDAEDEPEAEEESDEGSDDDLYEVEGETFTLKDLKEWKSNGMRQSDYTRKTQELSEERNSFNSERAAWEAERDAMAETFNQEKARLQEALATFAIEQDPEPSTEGKSWEEYTKQKAEWDKRQAKRDEARQAHAALVQEQHQQVVQREMQQLVRHIPEWRDPEQFSSGAKALSEFAAQEYGFSPQEMAGVTDHRMLRALNDLRTLKEQAANMKTSEAAAAKKVTKAAKKLAPGAKPNPKNQNSKQLRQSREQLKKTGSIADGAALLRAKRAAS